MLNNPYLKLLRIPNIFTIPSNIILGYLIAISLINNVTNINYDDHVFVTLSILISSSIFLYLGGLVSNDYFDVKTDSIERPNRPIPSGSVPKKNAFIILVCLFSLGLILSILASIASLLVSVLLVICILSYNYRIKNGFFRSYLMGFIRGLNVFYGFSFILSGQGVFQIPWSNPYSGITSTEYYGAISILFLVSLSMFIHVLLLTHISKREVGHEPNKKHLIQSMRNHCYLYLVYIIIFGIFGLLILPHRIEFTLFLISYTMIIFFIFYSAIKKAAQTKIENSMQYLVKNMIIVIILLDSAFIAGLSGYIPAMLTCLLIIPAQILSRKVNMT